MALLNMLVEEGIQPIVCHVNYHRRPESNWEQTGLEQFCLLHNLELNILDTKGLKPTGNFQTWARNIRYHFFRDLYREYCADGLLVAHHEDDLIETYILQKTRKTLLLFYGLAEKSSAFDMNILRPLLSYSKANLLKYCVDKGVPFSIDSSNLTDHYQRNRIRHSFVEKMTMLERTNILSDIKRLNDATQSTLTQLKQLFPSFDQISITLTYRLTSEAFSMLLYLMLKAKNIYVPLNTDLERQVWDLCHSQRPNATVPLGKKWQFERQYDTLFLRELGKETFYSFVLTTPQALACPFFHVDFSEGFLKEHISEECYPITIRPAVKGDNIQVGQFTKRVNRLYIDWKLPLRLRTIWPVVVDKNGNLVFIPRYQKNPEFSPQSNFVINESFDYVE